MDQSQIATQLMRSAICGVSKTQTLKYIKKEYNLTNQELNQIVKLCSFKSKPYFIDYGRFADRSFPRCVKKFDFPFTQIYEYRNFLSLQQCSRLIEMAELFMHPSSVSNPKDDVLITDYRTSSTSDLHYFDSHTASYLDTKMAAVLGLDPFLGETLQVQKYLPGQYYKEHHDFFPPFSKEYKTYTEWMGQRTWTVMVYLNGVKEGGETYFKHLDLKIKPEAGKALIWNNLWRNGIPNYKTKHEALPPISGNKYVITKWWRSWSLI